MMESTADFSSAFHVQTTLRNTGSKQINSWTLSLEAGFEIVQIWGAIIVSHTGTRYLLESTDWTAGIAPDSEVSFGFIAAPERSSMLIELIVNGNLTDADSNPTLSPKAAKQTSKQATISNNSTKLSWSISGVTSRIQEIKRANNPKDRGKILSNCNGTEFVDNNVYPGTTYYWIKVSETDRRLSNTPTLSGNITLVAPENDIGAVALSKKMGVGWNAGNSLDAIGGETAWGNPLLTQQLFNAVKDAGFDTVRLPVAWSVFTDADIFAIDNDWLARVSEVIDYALNAHLYVIINIHWDGGWMQPTYGQGIYVNNRLATMWKQIATHFRSYDNRLLFAGTNEVMVDGDYGAPTKEHYTVQNSFNQTFVTTVRNTGGNNTNRHLIIQGFNTNIDHTVNFADVPTDTAANRLMMEVHYYDPYNFTLNTDSSITQWGSIATDPFTVEDWANENWVDSQFQKMKSCFIDKGIGVVLGEFGVASRPSTPEHERYRVYWNKYISHSAVDHGLVPIYWDSGKNEIDSSTGVFDRYSGRQLYPDIIKAIVSAVK
jgi:endoglucanase